MGVANSFRSVLSSGLPLVGLQVGDVYYTTDTKLLYAVVGDLSLIQLLVSTPIPVVGPQGPTGPTGPTGPNFIGQSSYVGSWLPSPQTYAAASVVSYSGFLYLSLAALNVSNNEQAPAGNPFWQVLGPVSTVRTSEIVIVCDGAGSNPLVGSKGYVNIPTGLTLTGWVLTADQVSNCAFDVKWCQASGFPATSSIVNGNFPALVAAQKASGNTSGWSKTAFVSTDILEIDLTSVSTALLVTLTIQVSATN